MPLLRHCRWGLVGHGLYRRQVLGLPDAPQGATIFVRRFLCLACGKTTSILPEEVHPRRWYAGAVILIALARYLILGWSAEKVLAALDEAASRLALVLEGCRTRTRWRHLRGRSRRLRGLLVHLLAPEPKPPDVLVSALADAARDAVLGTMHA